WENLLLHQAHQRLGESERRLVEAGVSAFLGPTRVPRLGRDDHGWIHDEGVAYANRRLCTVVPFQGANSAADIPRSRRAGEALIVRPASEQPVPLDIGIDPRRIVLAVVGSWNLAEVVVGSGERIASQVRIRITGDDIGGDRIDAGERNSVSGEERSNITAAAIRRCRERIGNLKQGACRIECLRKVTCTLQGCRSSKPIRPGCSLPQTFKVKKPEYLVLDDRPTRCQAVLVEVEGGALRAGFVREKGICVEFVVAEEIIKVSVQLVCPTFGHYVDEHTTAVTRSE